MGESNNPPEQFSTERISSNCVVKRNQNRLKVEITFSEHTRTYKQLTLIFLPIFLFCVVFAWLIQDIQGIIFLIFLILLITPSLSGYLYNKNKIQEWIFDKSQLNIIFTKRLKHFMRSNTYYFSEITSLLFQRDNRYIEQNYHKLLLKINQNKIEKIYVGEKEECKNLGTVISNFISFPLQYKPHRVKISYHS